MSDPTAPRTDASGVAPIITHRLTPPGVLPRRGQVWLMVGVAGGILAIILFTGNHDPAPPRTATAPNVAALAPNPEQLRTYQRRLEAADTRPQSPASLQELRPAPPATDDRGFRDQGSTRAQDPIAEERRRREYESLFATNVVQSPTLATTEPTRSASPRRTTPGMAGDLGATPPSLDDVAEAVVRASTARTSVAAPTTVAPATSAGSPAPVPAPGVHRGRRSAASYCRRHHRRHDSDQSIGWSGRGAGELSRLDAHLFDRPAGAHPRRRPTARDDQAGAVVRRDPPGGRLHPHRHAERPDLFA